LSIKDFTIIQKHDEEIRIESSFDHKIENSTELFRSLETKYPKGGVFHDTVNDHEELKSL